MNEDSKLGLSSMISIVVGVISLIVVIPTIALIMNKTKPVENVAIMHFDRADEDYFINLGAVYTLNLDSNYPSNILPGYDFNFTSGVAYDYTFNSSYYASISGTLYFIDRVVNHIVDGAFYYYDGVVVDGSGSGDFLIYGLSNY